MYVVYNLATETLVKEYPTKKGATRLANKINKDGYAVTVMSREKYDLIGKTKMVKNLMTGEMIEIAADTPIYCDPSSETYWSM
jgi:hypothetical protein